MRQDTQKLLRTGSAILSTGIASVLMMATVFGGIGREGPHTNSGWLALMVAMACLPTGSLILILALTKLFSNHRR